MLKRMRRRPVIWSAQLLLLPAALAAALAGCAEGPPVSADLKQDLVAAVAPAAAAGGSPTGFVAQDLKSAAFNLDQAVVVGALDAKDPAPGCLHAALKQLGLEEGQVPAPSFQPRRDGLLSEGAVLYVRAQQAKRLRGGGIELAPECQQLIGRILLDSADGALRASPAGAVLRLLR